MGCDIHAHIEFPHAWTNEQPQWYHYAGVWLPRHYRVFGHMAGVRSDAAPVVAARGFPEDADWDTKDAYSLRVRYDKFESSELQVSECLPESAGRWLAGRSHTVVDIPETRPGTSRYHLISSPDWHTPSWLSTAEFKEALRRADDVRKEYHATLAAMAALNEGEVQARLVFWFDN